jgi:uncharacterized membrane-anchored protein YjiN (DUF445 family)
MHPGRNRIGFISLGAAFAGFLIITFQPWLALDGVRLFKGLSLQALLSAFFDASLVGALADWFAVTALFKRPLGVKLPHTDILARNKDAIAEAVPRFLTSFVSEQKIAEQLGAIDFAQKVRQLLGSAATRAEINEFLRGRLSALLDGPAGFNGEPPESFVAVVREILLYARDRIDAARALGAILRWSHAEGMNDRIIATAAEALRAGIDENFEDLADTFTPLLKRNAGWQGIFVGRGTIEKLLRGAMEELQRVGTDPHHDLRLLLGRRLAVMSSRLSDESANADALADRVRSWFRDLLSNPGTHVTISRSVARALAWLHSQVQPESRGFSEGIEKIEDVLVTQLRESGELHRVFNRGVAGLISSLIARSGLIESVTGYLAGLLKATDEREFVDRVEDAVWNDLQYIRFNGAAVGGIVGILLAVVSSVVRP